VTDKHLWNLIDPCKYYKRLLKSDPDSPDLQWHVKKGAKAPLFACITGNMTDKDQIIRVCKEKGRIVKVYKNMSIRGGIVVSELDEN
jgi:hypothetical protein